MAKVYTIVNPLCWLKVNINIIKVNILMIMKVFLLVVSSFSLITLAPNSHSETLSEIFDLARKNDPEWAAKKQKYLADREKVEQSFGALLPNAALNASWGQQEYEATSGVAETWSQAFECAGGFSPPEIADALTNCGDGVSSSETYEATSYDLTITQPLVRMDRWYAYKQTQSLDNAAKAELAHSQQELMIRTAEAYFAVLRATEEYQLAQSEEKTLQTQLAEIKNRYQLGLARDTDLFEIQAQFDIAQAAVIVAQSQVEAAQESLAVVTGTYIEDVKPLPEDLPIEPPQPNDLAEWEDYAKKSNYGLIATQFAVEASKKDVSQKKSGHAPTADLFYRFEHRDVGGGFVPSNDTQTIGVKVSIPLYSGGIISSQAKEANYRLEETKHKSDLALRKTMMDTRRYFSLVNANVASVKARQRAVKSNNSSLRAIKKGWEDGIRTLSDALAAQRKVYQARKEYTTSRFDYLLNTFKLKQAAGVLSPNDFQNLNSWLDSDLAPQTSLEQPNSSSSYDTPASELNDQTDEPADSNGSLYEAYKSWRKNPE